MYQKIEGRGDLNRFIILPWPAYQPNYGPIEYKICDVILNIQYDTKGKMLLDKMEQAISMSAAKIGPCNLTFDHLNPSQYYL